MPDLLRIGSDILAAHFERDVVQQVQYFSRAKDETRFLNATIGGRSTDSSLAANIVVAYDSQMFLIRVATPVKATAGGADESEFQAWLDGYPAQNDRIIWDGMTHLVMPAFQGKPWSWTDGYHDTYRIQTKIQKGK